MTDPFSQKGYVILSGTSANALTGTPIFGFTPMGDMTLTAITHPTSDGLHAYTSDATALIAAGFTFKDGVYYPIKATAIQLASGSALGWVE